jgi:hypothetical protein
MNDEWRLQVDVENERHAGSIAKRLAAAELEHQLSEAFHDRLIVSGDGARLFVYAGTREQAEQAREAIARLADASGWKASAELTHWHPLAEKWEDPDLPLPQDEAARVAEHEELIATERRELEERGTPEFEVRVELPSHHDAAAFAERLRDEGLPVVRRWKYLVVGATDEDSAQGLAARLGEEAPAGSTVVAEGSGRVVWDERPPNPFAVFGGLGG